MNNRFLPLCAALLTVAGAIVGCHPTQPAPQSPPVAPPQPQSETRNATTRPSFASPVPMPANPAEPAIRDGDRPGQRLVRAGDEIMVCGQLFHTGAPVVLWTDPGGYDAYRTERRFAAWGDSSFAATTQQVKDIEAPARYGPRKSQVDDETFERVRGGGWDLPTLQNVVDQFVYHFDVCGTSRQCFNILHDHRALSVHFMLDLDGTIYQTLDLKERAWHATSSNSRSIGIEIANIGCYRTSVPTYAKNGNVTGTTQPAEKDVLDQWYRKDENGQTRVVLPAFLAKNSGIRTPNFIAHPIRNEPVVGVIQGAEYRMYDLTPQQYDSLIKLTAALCTVFPKMNCDAPRDDSGNVINHQLPPDELRNYQGLMGHYHVQKEKQDPGPAFDWARVVYGAQALMTPEAREANREELGHPALPVNNSPSSAPSTIRRLRQQSPTSSEAAPTATQPVTKR
jgi:N-acetylmuramoyl-L-alanine amidase